MFKIFKISSLITYTLFQIDFNLIEYISHLSYFKMRRFLLETGDYEYQ
jgi:hypothetical protein